ncbi:MAG: DUF3854 domain-containing protein [Lachnospiraceae bacterium]|nr:DUF3854 domain-containing protein [Lachnospiraceae bacterium]
MQQKQINRIVAKASEGANSYPIEDILSRFGVEYRIRGTQAWFRCPVCNKPKFDYCSATVQGVGQGKWCCQSCKAGGGTFRLYSALSGKDDTESLLSLGVLSGAITNEEYDEATGSEDSRYKLHADEKIREKIERKKAEETVERKAPIKTVDFIYRQLLSLPQFQLTEEGRNYLRGRRLSDEEIDRVGFFSYKEKFSVMEFMNSVSVSLYGKGLDEIKPEVKTGLYNSLWGIPGFYFEFKDSKKNSGTWRFIAPCSSCVGIPIKNSEGLITALQMRWLEGNRDNKYFYISSRKYHQNESKNTNFGSSPGSPVAVCYPDKITGVTFYVTEGLFKARELAKSGNVCYSVQGVNSFYYVADEIKETLSSRAFREHGGTDVKRVALAFDADMYSKWQVLDAAMKAAANISRKTEKDTYVLLWKPDLGKGFDDYKFNCLDQGLDFMKGLKVLEWREFATLAKKAETDADKLFIKRHSATPTPADRTQTEWGNYLCFYLYEQRIKPLFV